MSRVKIIAEIGPNHNGSIKLAKQIIKKISKLDIDYIKFQFSDPNQVYSKDSFKANYQKKNDGNRPIIEMSKKNQLTISEHLELSKYCSFFKKEYCCSFFDLNSIKKMDKKINLPFYKIPSGEICSIDTLKFISKKNKKILLSTGMADTKTIKKSINFLKKEDIVLLHCVSSYPTNPNNLNLNFIDTLKKKFNLKIGFSDHTKGYLPALGAIAKGAEYIEKHVTLNNNFKGPDHSASLNIKVFEKYVNQIRKFEKILGKKQKIMLKNEIDVKKMSRKSIVSKKLIKKGQIINIKDICFKRPGTGFNPLYFKFIINKKAKNNILKDKVINPNDLILRNSIYKKFLN
tara:strand:- start:2564 stop:3598 length:1035 start_codon:yes stop_codon:yes gene_type:complete